MVDQAPRYRSYDPDIKPYDGNPTEHRVAPYKFGQSARTDYPENSVPLFLSDHDDEPDPSEYITPVQNGRGSYISSRILAGVLATAAVAILVAVFSSDAAHDMFANAKVSSTAVLTAASAAVQPNPTQLTAEKDPAQSKDPARLSAPEDQTPGPRSVTLAAVAPTREDIKTAYRSAQQIDAPQVAAAAEFMIPADAIHHLDPGEIASSLRRGNDLIASGDLAGTYDPVVLEKLGLHGFVPDLAMARAWYEKAKKFGSAEAPQRLELLANKRQ